MDESFERAVSSGRETNPPMRMCFKEICSGSYNLTCTYEPSGGFTTYFTYCCLQSCVELLRGSICCVRASGSKVVNNVVSTDGMSAIDSVVGAAVISEYNRLEILRPLVFDICATSSQRINYNFNHRFGLSICFVAVTCCVFV